MSQRLQMLALLFLGERLGVSGFAPMLSQIPSSLERTNPRMAQSLEAEAASIASTPDMEAYSNGFKTVFDEQRCRECVPSVGSLPEDLVGTYFRSGPAMFSAGSIVPPKTSIVQPKEPPVLDGQDSERMVKHPFEGDGAVMAVTFTGNGTAISRFRFVRTVGFTNERRKGQRLYKAMDSTRELGPRAGGGLGNDIPLPLFRHHLQSGLNKNRKNTSNTRAVYWGKRLLSLWEGGLPYKLDALALSTEGRSQLGGILKEQNPFGAKAVYDPKEDSMLFYAVKPEPKSSELTLFEFNHKFRLIKENGGTVTTELPGFSMISDFSATENYAIFIQPPVEANTLKFMFSKEPGKTLALKESPSILHLVPRAGSEKSGASLPITLDGTMDANLQFCNAYEENGIIIVDAVQSDGRDVQPENPMSYPWMSTMDDFAACSSKKSLVRYTVDAQSRKVSKEVLVDLQCSFAVVNPTVSTQKHRYIYCSIGSQGSKVTPPQGIAKFDVSTGRYETWIPKSYEFCGEPMYAPRKEGTDAEDDGYILTVVFDGKAETSEMVVLKARSIAAGPLCKVSLGVGIPHGLYGCFSSVEESTWTADEIERRAKLADKIENRGNQWNEVKSDFSGLGLRLDDLEEYFGDIM